MERDRVSTGIERIVEHRLTSPSPSTRKFSDDEFDAPVGFQEFMDDVLAWAEPPCAHFRKRNEWLVW